MISQPVEIVENLDALHLFSWIYPGVMTHEEILANDSVALGSSALLIFYAIGASTIILATAISSRYVFRLSPKKILLP